MDDAKVSVPTLLFPPFHVFKINFWRRIWNELKPKWPRAYWDDWLREPAQRQGRHIIRPEVCRTLHFGARGVSNSQFSEVFLALTFILCWQLSSVFERHQVEWWIRPFHNHGLELLVTVSQAVFWYKSLHSWCDVFSDRWNEVYVGRVNAAPLIRQIEFPPDCNEVFFLGLSWS